VTFAFRNQTFAYPSVNFACNFVQERSKDAKKISQPHGRTQAGARGCTCTVHPLDSE